MIFLLNITVENHFPPSHYALQRSRLLLKALIRSANLDGLGRIVSEKALVFSAVSDRVIYSARLCTFIMLAALVSLSLLSGIQGSMKSS